MLDAERSALHIEGEEKRNASKARSATGRRGHADPRRAATPQPQRPRRGFLGALTEPDCSADPREDAAGSGAVRKDATDHDSPRRDIEAITERIRQRSKASRERYLDRIAEAIERGVNRAVLSCGNLAHGFAACRPSDKATLAGDQAPNLGIITSYNDMLSAHQPFETYPDMIKDAAREAGGTRRWRAACRPCATASRRASPAWSCRCSRAT